MNTHKGDYDNQDNYDNENQANYDNQGNYDNENQGYYDNKNKNENKGYFYNQGNYYHKNKNENKGNHNNRECREPEYCCEEKKCALRPNRTLLKCSIPITTNIPTTTAANTSFNLANLKIDTRKFHDPCIKFEFASNILTASGTLILNFQIFKQCKYQSTSLPVGPVWTFSRVGSPANENDTFTFFVCDCDTCDDEYCNYSVIVTIESLETQSGITIKNASLSALVVDNA